MIAIDTNVLVYAHRREYVWHAAARAVVESIATGSAPWAIPWPCVLEFFNVVTHPRIHVVPSAIAQAIEQIEAWRNAPHAVLIGEGPGYWSALRSIIEDGRIVGPQVHDAKIAAICLSHGVRELWTADRDFSRFPRLKTRNPLIP